MGRILALQLRVAVLASICSVLLEDSLIEIPQFLSEACSTKNMMKKVQWFQQIIFRSMKQLGCYKIIKVEGLGGFSTVYRAIDMRTERVVAVKQPVDPQEINIIKELDHPFICSLYEIVGNTIVMEFAEGGTLLDRVNMLKKMNEIQAQAVFSQLIIALNYLHAKGIVHRDIKAENILLDFDYNIKIIDFGLSFKLSDSTKMLEMCGSPDYASPEMIGGLLYDEKTDIWSAGVLLYAITVGKLPFHGSTVERTFRKINSDEIIYPTFLSIELIDLLSKMLCRVPEERITISEIMKHPWFERPKFNFDELRLNVYDEDLVNSLTSQGIELNSYEIESEIKANKFSSESSKYRQFRHDKVKTLFNQQKKSKKLGRLDKNMLSCTSNKNYISNRSLKQTVNTRSLNPDNIMNLMSKRIPDVIEKNSLPFLRTAKLRTRTLITHNPKLNTFQEFDTMAANST